jgi:Fe-S-cluster containining protein
MGDERKFDCSDCVSFCCSGVYNVALRGNDLARLSLRTGLAPAQFRSRYCAADGETLRHKPDPLFGEACVFLDLTARRCTVYEARPAVCREWPKGEHAAPGAEGRCCFYDLYAHVRNEQEPNAMPLVQIVRVVDATHPATLPKAKGAAGGR